MRAKRKSLAKSRRTGVAVFSFTLQRRTRLVTKWITSFCSFRLYELLPILFCNHSREKLSFQYNLKTVIISQKISKKILINPVVLPVRRAGNLRSTATTTHTRKATRNRSVSLFTSLFTNSTTGGRKKPTKKSILLCGSSSRNNGSYWCFKHASSWRW